MNLYKRGEKYWNFEDEGVFYTPSKFTINTISNDFYIVYENNLKSKKYNVLDVTLIDLIGGGSFTFANIDLFMQKLEELNCPCFQKDETTIINPPIDPSDFLPSDLTDYAEATLPIAETDKLPINQGGDWKKVNKSDLAKNETLLQSMWVFTTFSVFNTNQGTFFGTALNGGTLSTWYNIPAINRPSPNIFTNGYMSIRTGGTGLNRGFRFLPSLGGKIASLFKGFTFLGLYTPSTTSNIVTRIGIGHTNSMNSITRTANNNCLFEIVGNQLQFITSSSTSLTNAGPQITINNLEWLFLFIEAEDVVNPSIRFKVKKIDGTVIYDEVSNTRIPTGTEQMEVGIISFKTNSTSDEFITNIAYLGYGNEKPNFLKDF